MNKAKKFEEKQFLGFFTFSAPVVSRLKRDLLDVANGRREILWEFARQHAIDKASKELLSEFDRQQEFVAGAVRRLQLEENYQPGHFASDLEKGLQRLFVWKTRLPALLSRAEKNNHDRIV